MAHPRISAGILLAVLCVSGCASTPELASAWEEDGGGGPGGGRGAGGEALEKHWAFIQRKEGEVKGVGLKGEQWRQEQLVLAEMVVWLRGQSEATLARTAPEEVYVRLKVARERREREERERAEAVEARLEEYLDWAERRWARSAVRFRSLGREYLLTEHPLRRQTEDALTAAVLDWAFTHTQDPDFLSKSPNEVAVYLLARRSTLATAIELGQLAPPHVDYRPRPDGTEGTPEELAVELLVGFVPLVGEAADAQSLVTGLSVTGRELSRDERLLAAVGVLVPFVSGRLLGGAEMAGRAALLTGRSLEEVRVLQRVAAHLSAEDARELERMLRAAAKGERMEGGDAEVLRRIAQKLEVPLAQAAERLRRGDKVPFLGVRTGAAGVRLVAGEPAHLAQCWVDYQFRHPGKYPRFSYAPDEEWKRLYESILRNKEAGTGFEQTALKAGGYEKNVALMMPPPGGKLQGFIPDAVRGNPGELVWGRPYHFVEVKARGKLDLGGNLKAMLNYVSDHGGHVELWVRSAKHPDGPTRISKPLMDRLTVLENEAKAAVRFHP